MTWYFSCYLYFGLFLENIPQWGSFGLLCKSGLGWGWIGKWWNSFRVSWTSRIWRIPEFDLKCNLTFILCPLPMSCDRSAHWCSERRISIIHHMWGWQRLLPWHYAVGWLRVPGGEWASVSRGAIQEHRTRQESIIGYNSDVTSHQRSVCKYAHFCPWCNIYFINGQAKCLITLNVMTWCW